MDRFGPLPLAAGHLIDANRIAILARAAGIARIDAGPAAIALTRREAGHDMSQCSGLSQKDGCWLLKEHTDEADRLAKVTSLLENLVTVRI